MLTAIFFGTQDFAASILESILASGEYELSAVVTQPDRPAGRRQEIIKSPVKLIAEKYNLRILQPETLKNWTKDYGLWPTADLYIVCQYGLIIPRQILDITKHGIINIHTSLLPKYRGASPIQTTLTRGDTETGISIMLMDEKMDHGPILAQEKIAIDSHDTYHTLSKKMEPLAAKLLLRTIPQYLNGNITSQPQDETQATFCKMITRDNGRVDWSKSAAEIYNLYRGLTPWPGIWTTWNGTRLKLLNIRPSIADKPSPGLVREIDGQVLAGCGQGAIEILELQLAGKSPRLIKDFLLGHHNFIGATLD